MITIDAPKGGEAVTDDIASAEWWEEDSYTAAVHDISLALKKAFDTRGGMNVTEANNLMAVAVMFVAMDREGLNMVGISEWVDDLEEEDYTQFLGLMLDKLQAYKGK
jgi:hypothetical protein